MSMEQAPAEPGTAPALPLTAEEAVARYAKDVYALALAKTRCREDADDVFQEAFLAYIRSFPVFESERQGKVWFSRVTLNCCKMLWRSKKRRETVPLDSVEPLLFARQEDRDIFLELENLPRKDRAVLELTYFAGLSAREAGKVLGCSENAVRVRLTRARRLLEKRLRDDP